MNTPTQQDINYWNQVNDEFFRNYPDERLPQALENWIKEANSYKDSRIEREGKSSTNFSRDVMDQLCYERELEYFNRVEYLKKRISILNQAQIAG